MPPARAQTLPAIRLPWPDNRWDCSDSAHAAQCSGWPSSLSLPLQAKCGRFLELHLSGSPALLYIFAGVAVQVSWTQPSAIVCTSFSFGYSSPWLHRPIPAPEAHLGTISFKKRKMYLTVSGLGWGTGISHCRAYTLQLWHTGIAAP